MVEWKRKLEILSWSSVVQTLEIFALNSHDNHDPHSDISELNHCVKSGQIRSFFWSVFSRIRTEYGEILYKIKQINLYPKMRCISQERKEMKWRVAFTYAFYLLPMSLKQLLTEMYIRRFCLKAVSYSFKKLF